MEIRPLPGPAARARALQRRKGLSRGPGIFNWNLSLSKTIPLTAHEGPRIELRFESFNTFNHVDFQGVDTGSHDGNFGAVTSDYGPARWSLAARSFSDV